MGDIVIIDGVKLKVQFTQASEASNISSGENIAVSFGKLSKWIDDFPNFYKVGTEIQSGSDLNTYTATGNYYIASGTNASNISNVPTYMDNIKIAQAAKLIVFQTISDTRLVQMYFPNYSQTPSFFYRVMTSGGWSRWVYISPICNVGTAVRPSSGSSNIKDLNNFKIPGSYDISSATYAGRITNSPITNAAYRLVVIGLTDDTVTNMSTENFRQEIYPVNDPSSYYVRHYTYSTDSWSSWYKFSGVVV